MERNKYINTLFTNAACMYYKIAAIYSKGDKMSKTVFRGITKSKASWVVRLRIEGKKTYLGSFKNIEDAILCINAAERLYYPKRKPQFYNPNIANFSGNIGGIYVEAEKGYRLCS